MRNLAAFAVIAAVLMQPALAQSPAESLAARLTTICATAPGGTDLFVRCAEIFASTDPLARLIAATGQRLDEIPGQARVATRDVSRPLAAKRVSVSYRDPGSVPDSSNPALLSLTAREEGGLVVPWSLFFSADIGRIKRKISRNEAAFDAGTGSVTAGIDWQAGKDWQIGAAANHVRENLDFSRSGSEASTRFTGLLATASRSLGQAWSLNAYYGRFRGGYRLSRNIAYSLALPAGPLNFSAQAKASPAAQRRVSGLALNGQWAVSGWDLGVVAGMDQTETRIDAYAETGGRGLDLAVPGRSVNTRRGRVDLTLGRTFSGTHGVFQPSLRLGWRREFSNPRRPVSVSLVEDPLRNSIRFDTEDPDRTWGELALGGVMTLTGGHSGFLELRQRVAHSFLRERMFALGWRIEL